MSNTLKLAFCGTDTVFVLHPMFEGLFLCPPPGPIENIVELLQVTLPVVALQEHPDSAVVPPQNDAGKHK
jgi:hypothetical protein